MRAACRPWLTNLPNLCWDFREFVVAASCTARMSTSGGLGVAFPHSNQDSGTIPSIASFATPHLSRISRKLPPSLAMILDSGSPLLAPSPQEPVRSARTSGRIPTLLPIGADTRLASAEGNLHPSVPVEWRVWACWWGCSIDRSSGPSPGRKTVPPRRQVA